MLMPYKLSEHRVRGWRVVSAARLQGKGSHARSAFHRHRYGDLGLHVFCL